MNYTPLRRYYRGDELIAMRDVPAGVTRYYHFDHQGTTQALTDSTGAVTDRFAADAWGVEVKRTGSSINRQWYVGKAGYYQHESLPTVYVRLKYLLVRQAAWASIGNVLQGATPYSYGGNSPALFSYQGGDRPRISVPQVDETCRLVLSMEQIKQLEEEVKKLCNAMSDSVKRQKILDCARRFGVDEKCVTDWCAKSEGIGCDSNVGGQCGKVRTPCKNTNCPNLTRYIIAPNACAWNECNPDKPKDPNPTPSVVICTYWITGEWEKACPEGKNPCTEKNKTFPHLPHEIGHLCGNCTAGVRELEARMDGFARCTAPIWM